MKVFKKQIFIETMISYFTLLRFHFIRNHALKPTQNTPITNDRWTFTISKAFIRRGSVYSRQYAGHMKDLGVQVGQVGHDEYEDGLDHANLVGEPCNETGTEAPYHSYYRATDRHHKERSQSREHVRVKYFRRSYLVVSLEHMVQHLRVIKQP